MNGASSQNQTQETLFGNEDEIFGPKKDLTKHDGLFAEIAFDRSFERNLNEPLTYIVPNELRQMIRIGQRVGAPLGRTREETGFVVGLCTDAPDREYRKILRIIDPEPLIDEHLLRLTGWMAEYYLCSWGQVLASVIPAGAASTATPRGSMVYEPTDLLFSDGIKLTPAQIKVRDILKNTKSALPLKDILALASVGSGPVDTLVKRGLVIKRQETGSPPSTDNLDFQAPILMEDQQTAWAEIRSILDHGGFKPILLRGVTGSGKTEVYLQAIQEVLSKGLQALVLVPEISLTPQTVARFQGRCGETAVLHSNLSPAERGRYWRRVASGEAGVAVGARSAIFAPARKLGLIIVDEEHESSFKQENTPRYNARDVAVMRARMLGIPVILGSATPSLESWNNAIKGHYKLLELPRRVMNLPMPKVDLIDLRYQPMPKGEPRALSEPLTNSIHDALKAGGQVLLLLNRRGWAPQVLCPKCGKVIHCNFCDIPMTYHRGENRLRCHHCAFSQAYEIKCAQCFTDTMIFRGIGTERLVEELGLKFPGRIIRRMDSDTVRKPGSHQILQDAFRQGLIDILVGTQMIAKGLDFPNVQLVGVIHADIGLQQPDFRASERTFQLLAQVAGRAGRKEKNGRVLVQTYQPDHPSIALASKHDFLGFAKYELEHRHLLGYPPYQRMARIIIRGLVDQETVDFADQIGRMARNAHAQESVSDKSAFRILGPAPAPVARIENHFRHHLQFQSESPALLHRIIKRLGLVKAPTARVEMAIDIDPQTIL
jgi:primosomal protein N' (replication factor Y)